jgi:Ran GTPase-activating protein (RanGAP) involved in mRNA processing and transport
MKTKFLERLEEKRQFLKLYYDESITIVNINRVLNQDNSVKGLKELQDLVKSLRASSFITHFSHHSSEAEFNASLNAKALIPGYEQQLQTYSTPQYAHKQYDSQRENLQDQLATMRKVLPLPYQLQQIITQGLPENKSITYLDLSDTFMQDEIAKDLAKMFIGNTSITYLNLTANRLGEAGGTALTEGLGKNTSLGYLNLSKNTLTPKVIELLATSLSLNTKLSYLNLSHNAQYAPLQSSEAICNILSHSKAITHLDLSNMGLGTQGLSKILPALNEYSALKYLKIATNNLDINSAKDLAKLLTSEDSVIEYLDLSCNPLNLEAVELLTGPLAGNNNLRHLEIRQVGTLGKDGGNSFAKLLASNKKITVLNIGNNALDYIGTKLLAESLKTNATLTKVDISSNRLDEAGGIYMSKALETNRTLTTLDLRDNNIQSAGVIYLAAALDGNKVIRHLNLSGNQIYDDGIEALAAVLTHLRTFNLSKNQITASGAQFLAQAIGEGAPLVTLILDNNPLQEAGVLAILEALKPNYLLSNLGIGGTDLDDQGFEKVCAVLKANIGVAKLNLSGNAKLGAEGTKYLVELIANNSCLVNLNLKDTKLRATEKDELEKAIASSACLVINGIIDNFGKVSTALATNVNLFQSDLRQLTTDQGKKFDSQYLYKLVHQIQNRSEAIAPELSYSDMKSQAFYLDRIAKLFELIKSSRSAKSEDMEEGKHVIEAVEDRFFKTLESIDITGEIELPFDMN